MAIDAAVQGGFARREPTEVKTLTGPSLDAHEGIRFAPGGRVRKGTLTVPGTSAMLAVWKG